MNIAIRVFSNAYVHFYENMKFLNKIVRYLGKENNSVDYKVWITNVSDKKRIIKEINLFTHSFHSQNLSADAPWLNDCQIG